MGVASSTVSLTRLSHGAGCGCKLSSAALRGLLGQVEYPTHPDLLVGIATGDDAGVIRMREDLALVQTVDFFTPIVDDPYWFGRIAATNALSDVYAMGGEPLTALNLLAVPLDDLGNELVAEILRGGADAVAAAGAAIVGGHSIDDPEPKYGLAVTGTVHPDEVLTNAGAHAGDVLVLTKPLGVGAIVTAARRGAGVPAELAAAVETMTTLNDAAARAARTAGASAVTDITGFGLLGHLRELALASGLTAHVDAGAVPLLPGVLELIAEDAHVCGGSARNRADADAHTVWAPDVQEPTRRILCDAMTSGGLLIAVAPERANEIDGARIGRLTAGVPGRVEVGS